MWNFILLRSAKIVNHTKVNQKNQTLKYSIITKLDYEGIKYMIHYKQHVLYGGILIFQVGL